MQTNRIIAMLTLAAAIIVLNRLPVCGQENFIPGYIIQKNGDTVHGFVDYRNWDKNPDAISFKGPGGTKEYTPLTIGGFGVKDEIYKSATIKTEKSLEKTNDLTLDPSLDLVTVTTFLQAVIIGEKSLYFYKGMSDKEQFYIPQDTSYEFLIHKKYLVTAESMKITTGVSRVTAENKKYAGQLAIYLQDCPGMISKIYSCQYKKSSLEKLFLQYYDCTKAPIEFHKETEKLKVEFGALAGVSLTKPIFHSESYDYLVNPDYPLSVNFSGGLFMDLIIPRGRARWSVDNELMFTTYKEEGQYTDYTSQEVYTTYDMSFGFSYIKLINMIRYKFPVGNFTIYGNAGWSNGVIISSTNYMKTDEVFYTQERITEGKAIGEVRKWEVGFIGGIGAKYNRFSIEARFERSSGMNWEADMRSGHIRYYFLLGCRF